MSCDIDFANVQDLNNQYQEYCGKLGEKTGAIGNACNSLAALPTFQGQAAMAVKARFGEAHVSLLASLDLLAQQLMSDYNSQFYPQFKSGAISESQNDARWPTSVMYDAERTLSSWAGVKVPAMAKEAMAAVNALPAGSAAEGMMPKTGYLTSAIGSEKSQTGSVRKAVNAADEQGYSTFAAKDGEFANLQRALKATMRACANAPLGSSQASFKSVAERTGLSAAYGAASANQAENVAIVNQCRTDSINGKIQRDIEASRKALEEKRQASWWGLAGSVAMFVGGAVALVATAGAATPLLFAVGTAVGTYGLTKSASDVYSRVKQVTYLYTGDPLADLEKADSKLGDAYKKVASYAEKGIKFNQHVEDGLAGSAKSMEKADLDVRKLIYSGMTEISDGIVDAVVDSTDDQTGAAVKTGYTVAKEVGKQLVAEEFKGSGIITAAGKAIEVVADYNVKQADAKLEALAADRQHMEDLLEGVGQRRQWAVAF